MVGSKDLQPSKLPFFGLVSENIFFNNQFKAKPHWPSPNTNLSGQTAIVTGSNVGLGYQAALQLLGLKLSHLILAVRSPERGEAAASKLRQLHPKASIEVWILDMSSYPSIQDFARRVESGLTRLDIVILNAGVMKQKFGTTKATGHEETFQINYLSTTLLLLLLLPILKAKRLPNGPPAHLTIASAALSLIAKFPQKAAFPLFPALDNPKTYSAENYNTSKLLCQMFLWNLVDYVSADDVIVNLADPAWCKGTELNRDADSAGFKVATKVFGLMGRTQEVGASCFVDAVVNQGKESHGCFLMSWEAFP